MTTTQDALACAIAKAKASTTKCVVCRKRPQSAIGCYGLTCDENDCNRAMADSPMHYLREIDRLARAIDCLGAKDLGNGYYAYRAHTARREWRVTSHLERLAALLSGPNTFAREHYPIEAAHLESVEMPSWWKPEQQFAISYTEGRDAGHVIAYETLAGARAGAAARKSAKPEVLTVDLTTGEEIAA